MIPKIIVHYLIGNEERFIWYSLQSVLPYVDKVMVWDTGSTDKTVSIIKSITSPKIIFRQVGSVNPQTYAQNRQKLLEATPKEYTWIMIVDGDEVWPKTSIQKVIAFAKNFPEYESIIVRTHNLVGDIYHRLPESSGNYHLAGKKGHIAMRLMNRKAIEGLHANLPHGQFGYFDSKNTLVQNRNPRKMKFINVHYAHATHLERSSADKTTMKRPKKLKHELGEIIQSSQIPTIFFKPHPKSVPTVTHKASPKFWIISALVTPIKRLRRIILPPKSGY